MLTDELKSGDLFLTLGAGSIHTVGQRWLEAER
jgi:UDP-N-acetylmuramate-alanine ligase